MMYTLVVWMELVVNLDFSEFPTISCYHFSTSNLSSICFTETSFNIHSITSPSLLFFIRSISENICQVCCMDSVIGTDLETGASLHFVDPSTLLLSIFLEILLEIV